MLNGVCKSTTQTSKEVNIALSLKLRPYDGIEMNGWTNNYYYHCYYYYYLLLLWHLLWPTVARFSRHPVYKPGVDGESNAVSIRQLGHHLHRFVYRRWRRRWRHIMAAGASVSGGDSSAIWRRVWTETTTWRRLRRNIGRRSLSNGWRHRCQHITHSRSSTTRLFYFI